MGNKRNKKKQQSKLQHRCFRGNQFVDSDGKEHAAIIRTKRARPARSGTAETPTKKQKLTGKLEDDERNINVIINFGLLSELLVTLCQCPECYQRVVIDQKERFGFALCFSISCCVCDWRLEFNTSKELEREGTPGKKAFEINYQVAIGFREIGRGLNAMQTFCQCANLASPMSRSSFDKMNERLLDAYELAANESMLKECGKIKGETDIDSVNDTTVTIDGTWQKRGHSSLNGVVTATSLNGRVVDFHVLSKYCKACEVWERKKGSDEYEEWKAAHNCKINHRASSGAMEAAGALEIFQRSVDTRNLQYTSYIGDGDTEAYKKVVDSEPYGPNVQIEKLECIGHIQKRLGSRLRKLRSQWKGKKLDDGKGISGRGRLTDVAINTMQNYFGMAIRQNVGALYAMKKAIGAVLYHCSDLDEDVRHQFCPRAIDSWCKWQVDRINETNKYKPKVNLPNSIKQLIYPVFKDLSSDDLLSKCLRGRTQNSNESFHQIIWTKCPKSVYVGRTVINLGVCSAVLAFNEGSEGIEMVFNKLGLKLGKAFNNIGKTKRNKQIKNNMVKTSEQTKRQRKKLRAKRKGFTDAEKEAEGGESYSSGAF